MVGTFASARCVLRSRQVSICNPDIDGHHWNGALPSCAASVPASGSGSCVDAHLFSTGLFAYSSTLNICIAAFCNTASLKAHTASSTHWVLLRLRSRSCLSLDFLAQMVFAVFLQEGST